MIIRKMAIIRKGSRFFHFHFFPFKLEFSFPSATSKTNFKSPKKEYSEKECFFSSISNFEYSVLALHASGHWGAPNLQLKITGFMY